MFRTAKFAAADASMRAGLSRLLPTAAWSEIVGCSSLEQISAVLVRHETYRYLGLKRGQISLEPFERSLRRRLAEWVRLPNKFLNGPVRRLVEWRWRRFEIDNLIVILRGVHRGASATRIQNLMPPLDSLSPLDWPALSSVSSPSALIERLSRSYRGEVYGNFLRNALNEYERTGRLFALETALYLAYYRVLVRSIRRLGGAEQRSARDLIGTMIDTQMVLSAYRYRTYFNFEQEEILSYTISHGVRVGPEIIQSIAAGAPLLEIIHSIWDSDIPETEALADRPLRETLVPLEFMFRRYIHGKAVTAVSGNGSGLAGILGYDRLLQDEVDDLIALVECTSARVPPEERFERVISRERLS